MSLCLVQDSKMDAQWKHLKESCQTVAIGSLLMARVDFP